MCIMVAEGFLAEVSLDEEKGCLRGLIVNAPRMVPFVAETVPALKQAMLAAIAGLQNEAARAGRPALEPTPDVSADEFEQMKKSELLGDRPHPPGVLPYQPLPAAYDNLLRDLFAAHETFTTVPDAGRRGAAMACAAVREFLSARWESMELASPFAEIDNGLSDVEEGKRPEIFFRQTGGRARPRSTASRKNRDFAAALLEVSYRVQSERSPGRDAVLMKAAQRVARSVKKWRSTSTRAKVTTRTVLGWRTEVEGREPADRRWYDDIVRYLSDLPPAERDRELELRLREGRPGSPLAEVPPDEKVEGPAA